MTAEAEALLSGFDEIHVEPPSSKSEDLTFELLR